MSSPNNFKTRHQKNFNKLFVGVFLAACCVSEVYPSPTVNFKNQLLKRQISSPDAGSSNSTALPIAGPAPPTAPGTNPPVGSTGPSPSVVPVAAPPAPPAPPAPKNPVVSTSSSYSAVPLPPPPSPSGATSIPPATPGPVTASPANPVGAPAPSPPAVAASVPPAGGVNASNPPTEKPEGTTQVLPPPVVPPPAVSGTPSAVSADAAPHTASSYAPAPPSESSQTTPPAVSQTTPSDSPPAPGPLTESTPLPKAQQDASPVAAPAPAVSAPASPVSAPAPPVAAPALPPAPASNPTPQADDTNPQVVSSPVPVLPSPKSTDSGITPHTATNVTNAPVTPISTTPTNSSTVVAPITQVSTESKLPTNGTTSQDSGASVHPSASSQNSSDTSVLLPPASDQKENDDGFTHLPPAPGQTDPDSSTQSSQSSGFSLPPAPGQTDPDPTSPGRKSGGFSLPPAPGQSNDLATSSTVNSYNSTTPLPISKQTWAQLNIDYILIVEDSTIDEYARKNKGGNFICGIGETCNAGQLSHPIQSPAWQLLYAAQEYNRFMNAMVDSVKYTLSMLQSTSAAMTNDLFENITDSRFVLDLKWVFTDLYRGITYGAVAALIMAWVGISAAIPFVIFGTAFGAGLAAWIQGTPKTVTYQSWTQLSFYIAESEDRIISSITNSFAKSLASPINSDLGLGHVLKGGTFFQPTTNNGIMETMEKNTMKMFQARVLSRMLRQNNAFVTIGESDCKGPGPGGAWGGNDVISYCDPKAKLMYNVIRAHKKKSKNTIHGASAIINKYGFSAEYITKTSWACQQKYGRFEHDVYSPNNLENFPTDLNDDCAINLPVCDTRLPDVREQLKDKHKSTVVACRKGAGLPI